MLLKRLTFVFIFCSISCFTNINFEPIGGIDKLDENFDPSLLIKARKIPKFYEEITKAWSEVSKTTIVNIDNIVRQPVWFNKFIKVNVDIKIIKTNSKMGNMSINQVWEGVEPNWKRVRKKGWSDNEYLIWRSILDAIPMEWRQKLREYNPNIKIEQKAKNIEISGKLCPVSKVNAKMIYWKFLNEKAKTPTAQKYIQKKLERSDIEWSSVYSKIYESTIDTKLRAFQFKILNNCLYLNQKLFLFKLVESPKCSFCFEKNETIDHFFIECAETKNNYLKVRNWLKRAQINFPDLNLENVLIGYKGNSFENFLFILWKFVLYNSRIKQKSPLLSDFQSIVKHYEKIEYIIAKKKSKLPCHLKKYDNIRTILMSTDT